MNEKRTSTVILDGKQPAKTIKELAADIRILGNHLKNLDRNSDAFKSGAKKMRELRSEMGVANQQMRNLNTGWGRFWKTVKATAVGVGFGNILTNLTGMVTRTIPELIRRNADLSDSFADIRKTTGLTDQEVQQLDQTLKTFNTRTSREELRELAVEAGRLGIEGAQNIAGFVRVADQIKVALGDDLGQDAAANIRIIGKLAEQFNLAEKEGVSFEEAMLKAGSAINELSASGSTQAEYLVNFTKRVSGVANTANISMDQVLAFAATLDEAGQNVEVSATTINKVLVNMFKDTATYADIAQMSVADFTDLLENDTNAAFTAFLTGLNSNNAGLTTLAAKLEDADLSGSRATAVLSALSANTEKLAQKQDISNKALIEGTSLTNEFNTKNNNLAGTLDKIGKKMSDVWLNSSLRNGVATMVDWFAELLGISSKLSVEMENERVQVRLLQGRIEKLNIGNTERVTLINELRAKYPKYLDNIDAETISNEKLRIALDKVNESLLNRIIIQKQQEQIEEVISKKADRILRLNQLETEVAKKLEGFLGENSVYEQYDDRSKSIAERWTTIYDYAVKIEGKSDSNTTELYTMLGTVQEIEEQYKLIEKTSEKENALIEQKNQLIAKYGEQVKSITTPEPSSDTPGDAEPRSRSTFISTPEEIDKAAMKARESYIQFLESIKELDEEFKMSKLDEEDLEFARINQKYDEKLTALQEFLNNKTITESEYHEAQLEIEALRSAELFELTQQRDADLVEQREKFLSDIEYLELNEYQREIEDLHNKYDEMLKLAEIYGIDSSRIEELRALELASIRDKYRAEELEKERVFYESLQGVYQTFGNALLGFMQSLGNEQSSWGEFARGLAFFHMAIGQATAISNALQTSSSPTPDNIATGGLAGLAKFATISAAILKVSAGIRSLVSGENLPTYSSTTTFERGGWMSYGPMHASGGMPVINPYNGTKQAEIEGGEAILSRQTVANNYSVVRQLLEQSTSRAGARIPQFNYGGMAGAAPQISGSVSSTLDASEFRAAIEEFRMISRNMKAEVTFTRDLIQTLRENINEQSDLESQHY